MSSHPPLAVITGAGSGIGRALALEAGRAGYDLVLVGRRLSALEETAAQIPGVSVAVIDADITRPEDRLRLCDAIGDGLDLLINNAGCLSVGRITDQLDEDITRLMNTNLIAPILLTRDLIPALARRKGHIANIGSMFGMIAFPYFASYSASKFALRGLSDALRRELEEYSITVSYIAPRATRTPAQSQFDHLIAPFEMKLDSPEQVARKAWRGITKRRSTVYPGMAERIFAGLNALIPAVVDNALIKQSKRIPTHPLPYVPSENEKV